MIKIILLFVGSISLLSCTGSGESKPLFAPATPEAQLKPNQKTGKIEVSIEGEKCKMDIHYPQRRGGNANFNLDCKLPDKERRAYFAKALDKIMAANNGELPFNTYSVGRLVSEHPFNKGNISLKLAREAAKSKQFNTMNLEANKNVDLASFVEQIIKSQDLFADYRSLFNQRGYKIKSYRLTNILVDGVSNVEHLKPLLKEGIKPYEALPYDAMVWFELEKL